MHFRVFFSQCLVVLTAVFMATGASAAKKSDTIQVGVLDKDLKPFGNPNAPQGGTMTVNLKGEPTTLSPITSSDAYAFSVQSYIMDTLMTQNPETYDWIPNLAEKAEVSPDGKYITFHLRQGLTFSDGHPLTAEDVKFSFDVIFDPAYETAHRRPYFENIEKVEAIDPLTVRFTTKNKYFGNFEQCASLFIVPKHFYGTPEEGKKKNKSLLGSGAYSIEKYDQGQSLMLVKNKTWWGNNVAWKKGEANFDHIRIRFLKDDNIALESLKKGDIDEIEMTPETYVKKTDGAEWGKTAIKEKVENLAPKGIGFVAWNLRRDLFKDRDVRVALAHLINREEMNKKFRFGMSVLGTGPWYLQNEYADPSVKPIEFDPKKAIALLNKAGWTDAEKKGVLQKTINGEKKEFRFTLSYANKDTEKYYVMMQADMKKIGIDMQLQLLEWNAFIKNLDDANFDAVTLAWTGVVDPDPKQVWHSSSAVKGGSNFVGYSNPEVDKMIDQAREELNKKKRIVLLKKVYKKIADDAPYAFMFVDKYNLYGHTSRMKMVKPTYKYTVGDGYWWTDSK